MLLVIKYFQKKTTNLQVNHTQVDDKAAKTFSIVTIMYHFIKCDYLVKVNKVLIKTWNKQPRQQLLKTSLCIILLCVDCSWTSAGLRVESISQEQYVHQFVLADSAGDAQRKVLSTADQNTRRSMERCRFTFPDQSFIKIFFESLDVKPRRNGEYHLPAIYRLFCWRWKRMKYKNILTKLC